MWRLLIYVFERDAVVLFSIMVLSVVGYIHTSLYLFKHSFLLRRSLCYVLLHWFVMLQSQDSPYFGVVRKLRIFHRQNESI